MAPPKVGAKPPKVEVITFEPMIIKGNPKNAARAAKTVAVNDLIGQIQDAGEKIAAITGQPGSGKSSKAGKGGGVTWAKGTGLLRFKLGHSLAKVPLSTKFSPQTQIGVTYNGKQYFTTIEGAQNLQARNGLIAAGQKVRPPIVTGNLD
jgi:hypothetical protein